MISYKKLFALMEQQGKKISHIRTEKIVGQETVRKLKLGTGIDEEYNYKNPKTGEIEKKPRTTSIDTKSIEALCTWLNCQPSDIMEVIPYTPENYSRLCKELGCTMEELPGKFRSITSETDN